MYPWSSPRLRSSASPAVSTDSVANVSRFSTILEKLLAHRKPLVQQGTDRGTGVAGRHRGGDELGVMSSPGTRLTSRPRQPTDAIPHAALIRRGRPPVLARAVTHGKVMADHGQLTPVHSRLRPERIAGQQLLGADDGIRTRDPHLGKASNTPARDRCNRWSPGQRVACTARDRWNRSSPLHWSSRWSSSECVESSARVHCGSGGTGVHHMSSTVRPSSKGEA